MSQIIPIQQAAEKLLELVAHLGPHDEIVLTEQDHPVARILPAGAPSSRRRRPGTCKGMLIINEEDDAHLDDFREYMP